MKLGKKRRAWKKGSLCIFLVLCLVWTGLIPVFATEAVDGIPTPECRSAILMEASTGTVLMEQNADEALPPASVTKVMTLLLVMEAIEEGRLRYEDMITASAHACSMGGSQIYLKEGEQMTAEDMIKSVVISSANDAAVALAEHLAGSEAAFVEQMNRRAQELGMKNTHFENTNGLDDTVTNHVTSARDIALMSRELIRHKRVTEYSSIWMDTIRDGAFGLTNTNRLVRFYRGATGLKTGSTSKAGFCVSATAEREGMTLICVIMGAPSRDVRNASATALLDYGFANFTLYRQQEGRVAPLPVLGGLRESCGASYPAFETVVRKGEEKRIEYVVDLPESLVAPVEKGARIGSVSYRLDGKEIGCVDVTASESVAKIRYGDVFLALFKKVMRV